MNLYVSIYLLKIFQFKLPWVRELGVNYKKIDEKITKRGHLRFGRLVGPPPGCCHPLTHQSQHMADTIFTTINGSTSRTLPDL
jgi:hypothetical protein